MIRCAPCAARAHRAFSPPTLLPRAPPSALPLFCRSATTVVEDLTTNKSTPFHMSWSAYYNATLVSWRAPSCADHKTAPATAHPETPTCKTLNQTQDVIFNADGGFQEIYSLFSLHEKLSVVGSRAPNAPPPACSSQPLAGGLAPPPVQDFVFAGEQPFPPESTNMVWIWKLGALVYVRAPLRAARRAARKKEGRSGPPVPPLTPPPLLPHPLFRAPPSFAQGTQQTPQQQPAVLLDGEKKVVYGFADVQYMSPNTWPPTFFFPPAACSA